ncbi:LuxR C-terminal-related transcriptional regulator [Streptomyces sp. NPDC047082]|uniref:LuxR C-terminal-related transcriptional regulator n=1 Tax=Streptomyces sp. NPDC047082 TaxID=3155259 RepID=UPI0033EB88BB
MMFVQARSRSVLMGLDNHMITSTVPALLCRVPCRTADMTARHPRDRRTRTNPHHAMPLARAGLRPHHVRQRRVMRRSPVRQEDRPRSRRRVVTRATQGVPRAATLPADLTAFVGRQSEVGEVRNLLTSARLLTLTGVGGVGKTRLALRVASLVTGSFPDGVCFVELAHVRDPQLVGESISAALGLQDRTGHASLEAVADHVAHRRLLLILDNCEHLADTCAGAVAVLLRAAPHLHVLTTSRQVLGVTGEQTFVVPPLPTPEPDGPASLEEVRQYHSVVLFEQRAAAVLPGFRLGPDNAESAARLVHRLEGLPLAIELAAASMRTLGIAQIQERLEDRFAVLTSGSRAALPRQRTLRALMDWSYATCSSQERELWARASVFSGRFDLAAAEAVFADDALDSSLVVEVVQGLLEKSVLVRQGDVSGEVPRYRMLETVREYGHQRLVESGALSAVRRMHRDHYLRLTAEAQACCFGPQQAEWLARIRGDHANLRVALSYCLTTPGEVEAGLQLAVNPNHYWVCFGSLSEGRQWLSQLLAAESGDSRARTAALGSHAHLCMLQGAVDEGLAILEDYRRAAEALQDDSALAWTQHHLALAAAFRMDLPRAAEFFDEAMTRHRTLGDLAAAAECMFKLAIIVCLLGDVDRALALAAECRELTSAHGECWLTGDALFAQSLAHWQRGDRDAADDLARQALRLLQNVNDHWGMALCIEVVAWCAAATGKPRRAARLLGILRSLWDTIGGSNLCTAPFMCEGHQQCAKTLAAALPEAVRERAYQEGAALDIPAAIAHVLEEQPSLDPGEDPAAEPDGPVPVKLTKREREVAELVAAGMSNKDIAAKLVIAPRTAENHVARTLAKLELTSRSQLAVWAYRQHTTRS